MRALTESLAGPSGPVMQRPDNGCLRPQHLPGTRETTAMIRGPCPRATPQTHPSQLVSVPWGPGGEKAGQGHRIFP